MFSIILLLVLGIVAVALAIIGAPGPATSTARADSIGWPATIVVGITGALSILIAGYLYATASA